MKNGGLLRLINSMGFIIEDQKIVSGGNFLIYLLIQTKSTFEKLVGDLAGAYSRRINIHHRLIYQVMNDEKVVKIIRLWTHYE
jgi:mRNA-degrading endonuclease YafQ of YafQ-DinJ toxin-antitoxin module